MGEFVIKGLADVEEIERIPLEERFKTFTTYEMIRQGSSINPDAPSLSFILSGEHYDQPLEVSHGQFLTQMHRAANLFHDLGVGPGDVISFLLPNLPHTLYTFFGGEAAGIVNPINPLLEPSTIRDICLAAKTKVLVTLGEFPGADIWPKVTAIRKELPQLETIVRVLGPSDEKDGILGFDEVLPRYNGEKLDSGRVISPEDRASILHTGGTTGTPKLAPRTHRNETSMAYMVMLFGALKQGETVLGGLPFFHNYAIMVTGLVPLALGGRVVLLSPVGYRDPSVVKNLFKIVERFKPVCVPLVPTLLASLLELPRGSEDLSSIRFVLSGAAPLSLDVFQRFEAQIGVKVREGYGLTEGTTGSTFNPPFGEARVGSVGVRLPYQEIRAFVLDEQGRYERDAETDEIGAVCIRGPNVFHGYLDPAHNHGLWPKERWLNTGDLGRLDADGYVWLTGRKKDLIIRGGHNIDPAAIEEPLYRVPGVQLCAAVGRPDAHAGEVPVAYVQVQGGSGLTSEKILDRLAHEIGERAAIPKEVVIVPEIPLTGVGKIFKPALRWDAIRRVYEAELRSLGEMADRVEVAVGEDKTHGSLARITVQARAGVRPEAVREKVRELLAPYTAKYEITLL